MEKISRLISRIKEKAKYKYKISEDDVRILIRDMIAFFRELCIECGYDKKAIQKIATKLRDAGRRSPPWKSTSSRVPGLPQDGKDGNRIKRWLLEPDHKFYADEVTATLVEIKYYLQLLSMEDAPNLPNNSIQECFDWLIEHKVEAGNYLDPIQLVPISLKTIMENARTIQSGHIYPLDRGGKHEPKNAFLMLHRSNQLQGNLTLDELIVLMDKIVKKHKAKNKKTKK